PRPRPLERPEEPLCWNSLFSVLCSIFSILELSHGRTAFFSARCDPAGRGWGLPAHGSRKSREKVKRVMRSSGGFWVILGAERGRVGDGDAFAGPVVEVDVGGPGAAADGCDVDDEAVILRRDFDAAGVEVLHGLVQAAVAELELVGARPERQTEQLMSEANA